jgi:DNA repair protein RadC
MYQRVADGALAEHEWLEVLLFNALPRRNTNDIAHRLINKFGTVKNLLGAPIEDIEAVKGVGHAVASYIKCVGHFFDGYQKSLNPQFEEEYSSGAFMAFVKKAYRNTLYEVVDLYLLDASGHVMDKKGFSTASICSVNMMPEAVTQFVLRKNAVGVVMVHNHPFGECTPSEHDQLMTKNMQLLCSMHNRLFCDHMIYASNGVYSYYLSGNLTEISENYSLDSILEESQA